MHIFFELVFWNCFKAHSFYSVKRFNLSSGIEYFSLIIQFLNVFFCRDEWLNQKKNNLSKWCINYVILLIKFQILWKETSFEYLYTYAPLLVQLDLELYTQTHILNCVYRYNWSTKVTMKERDRKWRENQNICTTNKLH